jgi:hypothetical protein
LRAIAVILTPAMEDGVDAKSAKLNVSRWFSVADAT